MLLLNQPAKSIDLRTTKVLNSMENCNLNTAEFPLLIVVTGLITIVIAVAKVGLRWSAKLVRPDIQDSAASDGKFYEEISANLAPVQVVSTDKGELVI